MTTWFSTQMHSLEKATWPQRTRYFLINALAFTLCYQVSNFLAQQRHVTRNVAFSFEYHMPFLEWMIIPYLSSGILFAASFLWIEKKDDLRVLNQRLLLATVSATLIFALYPLRFSFPKPSIASPFYAALFDFLAALDRPYNQLPSLHVAFCAIYWPSWRVSLKQGLAHRAMQICMALWLVLVTVATLFTYQHHLLDILGGLVLGLAAIFLIRPDREQPNVAFYYLMASGIVFLVGVIALRSVLALYLLLSLLLVSLAYRRQDNNFLHKHAGRHSGFICFFYAPYFFGYWLAWHYVRFHERRNPLFVNVSERLWIGRRLSAIETEKLPDACVIIDLSCELSETANLRKHPYRHFPLLDLISPDPSVTTEIVTAIRSEISAGRSVYLHCAMGYSRCILLAKLYMGEIKN